ncbi:MAG TPA: hypothetical protein VGL05_31140 [Kribbella sp.]
MENKPQLNAVRQLDNGELERFNGETWEPYPDIELDLGDAPLAVTRDEQP